MVVDTVSRSAALRQVRGSEEIAAALQGVEFPITKRELIERLGSASLRFDEETRAPLAELVRGIPVGSFVDAAQAEHAVNARWFRISKALAAVDAVERGEK